MIRGPRPLSRHPFNFTVTIILRWGGGVTSIGLLKLGILTLGILKIGLLNPLPLSKPFYLLCKIFMNAKLFLPYLNSIYTYVYSTNLCEISKP